MNAALVKTTATGAGSTWDMKGHPSPDPSGITYNSRTGQLLISDGEVEETQFSCHVYRGTNLFVASLQGELLETGANTLAYTPEPVGIGFRPGTTAESPERIFISDDDADRVFEVDRGADGRYGTTDDSQTSFSTRFTNSSQDDAEDVAVVLGSNPGELLIVSGLSKQVHVYSWGPDKKFNALVGSGGDDTVRSFDVGAYGATDPEGVAYNPHRDSILVVDDPSNKIYEFDKQGVLLNEVLLPITLKSGAGIALAPPSTGTGPDNAYIVDRGVDNDGCPTGFNDGRIHEVTLPGLTQTRSGDGTAPPPPPPPPAPLRYSHTFNADQAPDVVAARSDGALFLYPGDGRGGFLSSNPQIGSGWQTRDMIRHAQDWDGDGKRDIIARNPSNGDLWLYKGNGSGGFSGQFVIGRGWDVFTALIAPGDWNGDGNPDLIGVRSNGAMNLYPGNGKGGFGTSFPQIGSGWQIRDQIISVGDWDGDARPDLVARDFGNGDLWLYSGNGVGGFASQRRIGTGWNIMTALVGPGDFNGNGAGPNDILARRSNGDLYLYPGDGRGGFGTSFPRIGTGWSPFRIVSAGTN